jgi:acyl dehydratase
LVTQDSLIDAESASKVGAVAATARGEVNRRDWQRWAAAVGDNNPLCFDTGYARAHGYDDVICPPLYLQYAVLGVTPLDRVRPDGSSGTVSGALAFPRAPRRMAGGEGMTFFLPAYHRDDIEIGDAIPTLTVTVDETQMFFFSAATYNGHRIHYDKDWARMVEGYDNVLVQGPLQAALLARAVTDWIGGHGRLLAYSVQNHAIAFPGEVLTFGGVVTGKRLADDRGLVNLDICGRRAATVLMPGTATVALPRRKEAS